MSDEVNTPEGYDRCVVCALTIPEVDDGLCTAHKYDEQAR